MLKTIFFDAAGTLIHLPKSVGHHYALVGRRVGLALDASALDRAFSECWKQMPARPAIEGPREDDDKSWWRELVDRVIDQVAPATSELDRDAFFEVAYSHFAEAGVWELYPDVIEVLEALRPRFDLAVVSNFDGRLRMILEHARRLPIFLPRISLQRTRRRQTRSGNFPPRFAVERRPA